MMGFQALIVFLCGYVLVRLARSRPRFRRVVRTVALTLTLVLFGLWVTSMRYSFAYNGSSVCLWFKAGTYVAMNPRGMVAATGWSGFTRTPWRLSLGLYDGGMIFGTPGWLPLAAAAYPLVALRRKRRRSKNCSRCAFDFTDVDTDRCPVCDEQRQWEVVDGEHLARLQAGLCPHCEYNLTGNVSGVCSECGERV